MIVTGDQARVAIEEIKKLTNWTYNKIASKAGISFAPFMNIVNEKTITPHDSTLESIDKLHQEIRDLHNN